MKEDHCKGIVERDCYVDGCDRTVTAEIWHNRDDAERRADEQICLHFDREHRGEARIKIVYERRVRPHPEQELKTIVDYHHDRAAEDVPEGYELAYVVGEELEAADQIDETKSMGESDV